MVISLIGVGGIGSWFVDILAQLRENEQINPTLIIYDDDQVELKNVLYQDFEPKDLGQNKVDIIKEKHDPDGKWIIARPVRVESMENLQGTIISAVDNLKFRKMIYEHDHKLSWWLDMRSEGSVIAIITKHADNTQEVLANLIKGDLEENRSCQLKADLDNKTIQLGNRIVATIGAQYLLNNTRGKPSPAFFSHRF